MRWRIPDEGDWKPHFALIPRQLVDTSWVWLEWVQKRVHGVGGRFAYCDYRSAPPVAFKSCRTTPPPKG